MNDVDPRQALRRTIDEAATPVAPDEARLRADTRRMHSLARGLSSSRRRQPRAVIPIVSIIVVLVLITLVIAYGPRSGGGPGSTLAGTGSAKSRLERAFHNTFNAKSYEFSTSSDPTELTVVNAPDLLETIDGGIVSEIDSGNTQYVASWWFARSLGYHFSPSHCGPHARFIEMHSQGTASLTYSFKGDEVSQAGDVFTVKRSGTTVSIDVVQDGDLVRMTRIFSGSSDVGTERRGSTSGVAATLPGSHSIVKLTTDFKDIGHAPKILVPTPNEVVSFPRAFFHGCPL